MKYLKKISVINKLIRTENRKFKKHFNSFKIQSENKFEKYQKSSGRNLL